MLCNYKVQHIPTLDLGLNVQCGDDPMVPSFRKNSDFCTDKRRSEFAVGALPETPSEE